MKEENTCRKYLSIHISTFSVDVFINLCDGVVGDKEVSIEATEILDELRFQNYAAPNLKFRQFTKRQIKAIAFENNIETPAYFFADKSSNFVKHNLC